ncbi:alpha/beta fold hydrolase [Azohydromonas sp. G-1-1-14]|uniref:Alpha/beta fold hydrolase n=2 Tax=Azohydromonas caseinilytica TaxID=2728836 RepID=A0A848FGY0_9BURK|nr:alpha/beta fold hydrolase [Azohydromonas caseinilytica]
MAGLPPAGPRPAYGANSVPAPVLEVDGIPVHVEGQGDEVLLMLHGWPDTCRLWDAQVAGLREQVRCVRFTLPGFDPARGPRPMSLAQTLDLIDRVAEAVSPHRPLTLLLHDWGCVFGYEYALTHPARVRGLIGVDIGDAGSRAHARSLTLADKLMVASYQLWLAAAWRIGGAAGDAMSRYFARIARAPADPDAVSCAMSYPYYLAWTGAYADIARRMRRGFEPPCPMLYLYGRRKPLMFHSPSWAAALAQRPGHRVVALDAGHWLMLERPAEFNRAVRDWLATDHGR